MNLKERALITQERRHFHQSLLGSILTCNRNGMPSNADKTQVSSVRYARSIYEQLGGRFSEQAESSAQTKGDSFELEVSRFIQSTFTKLSFLRPGKWEVLQVHSRSKNIIGNYAQYAHLCELEAFLIANREMAAHLGNDYTVAPDIIVSRALETDDELNKQMIVVDNAAALGADLRSGEGKLPLLHASISCKWTLRSDRAQNARAEALNLIRNRKGRQPHIVLVTGEPTPSRLSSIALGTGDIDCVYHIALYELIKAVDESKNDEAQSMLNTMIKGKRLKDISDLPLDLAI